MFTGADAPPMKDGTRLRRGAETRYARWIADYLESSERLGVPSATRRSPDGPPTTGRTPPMPPDQSAIVYAALAGELRRRDLDARLVLGDTKGSEHRETRYLLSQAALLQPSSAPVAVASHAYVGYRDQARALEGAARRARPPGVADRVGAGCSGCADTGGMPEAIRWSGQIVKAVRDAGASAWFAFRAVADSTHGPGDALIVRSAAARAVRAHQALLGVPPVPALRPRGSFVLVVGESVPSSTPSRSRTGRDARSCSQRVGAAKRVAVDSATTAAPHRPPHLGGRGLRRGRADRLPGQGEDVHAAAAQRHEAELAPSSS